MFPTYMHVKYVAHKFNPSSYVNTVSHPISTHMLQIVTASNYIKAN